MIQSNKQILNIGVKKMTELEKNSQNGQAVGFMLIKSAEKKISAKGSPYLDMVLSDKGGEIPAKVWDYQGKDDEYAPGEIIKVKGLIDKWKNASQLKVERIRHTTPLDSVDMSTLVATTQLDPADMLNEIRKTVEEFSDEGLKVLVTKLLDDCGEKLLICSAAVRMHHAMRGGLLFHTLSMLRVSKAVCSVYPFLRKDLVYAGIIVHDLFKLKEISFADTGLASEYTPVGGLVGHIVGGAIDIGLAGRELGTDPETVMLLEHIVLSHHGIPEYGSPIPPMFPEAEVVSAIDHLDAALFEMLAAQEGVEKGKTTGKVWGLDRKLYRHQDDVQYRLNSQEE